METLWIGWWEKHNRSTRIWLQWITSIRYSLHENFLSVPEICLTTGSKKNGSEILSSTWFSKGLKSQLFGIICRKCWERRHSLTAFRFLMSSSSIRRFNRSLKSTRQQFKKILMLKCPMGLVKNFLYLMFCLPLACVVTRLLKSYSNWYNDLHLYISSKIGMITSYKPGRTCLK